MPQATKSEVPISWARDCLWAQIRPMRTFLSCDSKLNLRLVKIKRKKKGRIRLKNHSWIMSTGRERNGGEKWSIPKAEKTKKVNNFSNLILPKLKPSFKLALTSSDYIPSRKEKNNDQRQKTFFYFLTSFFWRKISYEMIFRLFPSMIQMSTYVQFILET